MPHLTPVHRFRTPNLSFQMPDLQLRTPNHQHQTPDLCFRMPCQHDQTVNEHHQMANQPLRRGNLCFRKPNASFGIDLINSGKCGLFPLSYNWLKKISGNRNLFYGGGRFSFAVYLLFQFRKSVLLYFQRIGSFVQDFADFQYFIQLPV